MKPWDFVLEAKGVPSSHVALDTDEEVAITLNYDPAVLIFKESSNNRSISLPTKIKISNSL